MPVRKAICPKCDTKLKLDADDPSAPLSVDCPRCRTPFTVPGERPVARVVAKPARKTRPSDDDDDRDRPVRNRASNGNLTVMLIVAGVALAALVGGGVLLALFVVRTSDAPGIAQAPDPTPLPGPQPTGPADGNEQGSDDSDDLFARAASFRPNGPLPRLPQLPPTARRPMLTLDPGGHTGFVRHAFFTPAADRVVTVSEDKSIRVWDMKSGETLHTIRVPAGPDAEGYLNAAALSPDGKTIAVSGVPVGKGEEGYPIYLLDTENGAIQRVVVGANAIIFFLDFSPDGKSIATGCVDGTVQVIEVESGRVTFNQRLHDQLVREARFHPKLARLASVGADDVVKIVDLTKPDKPIAMITLRDDKPNTLAWTSDGKTFATAGVSGTIHLFTGEGKPIRTLLRTLEKDATIQIVKMRFLPGDQEIVYGGIGYHGRAGIMSLKTGEARIQFLEHSNTVFGATCSRDGTLALSCNGELNETYAWKVSDGSVVQKFVGRSKALWAVGWAKDGKSLAFGRTNKKDAETGFHALEETFRLDSFEFGDAPKPDKYDRGLAEDDTYGIEAHDFFSFSVFRNHQMVYRYTHPDRIYSLTLLRKAKGIVVGGVGTLQLHDRFSGAATRRFVGNTGIVTAVAPSPDGRYFATTSSDHTIRIWSPDVDEPVLSLFAVGREWIAWTAEGYYFCSANGERLIAWQVNNGRDTLPDIHPASRFRASLFQSGMIRYLIPAGKPELAMAMAEQINQQRVTGVSVGDVLPPRVTLTAPVTAVGDTMTVTALATGNERYPVVAMRLLVDGRPFQGVEGVRRFDKGTATAEASWTVPIGPGSHSVVALAESTVSKGASRTAWVTKAGNSAPPNLYVLAVGVAAYPGDMKLNFAASDAHMLAKAMSERCRGVFAKVETNVITDRAATANGIRAGMDWLTQRMTAKDVGVVMFSGHGARDHRGQFYLVPVDVSENDPARTCISGDEFRRRLENMPGRLVAILDACHSGTLAERRGRADNLVRDLVNEDCGVTVMCSSMGREYSLESTETRAGFFTHGLVEGLSGRADLNRDGTIFINELDAYAAARVVQLSGGIQHPVTGRPPTVRPFPIARP